MSKTIQLIGVPTDIGAGARGASMGPEALRVAGIESMLRAHHLQVEDSGNLVGPANPWLPPTDGYRHLEQVRQWNQSLHEAYYEALKNGRLPITLGGDHCLGIGSISAVARFSISLRRSRPKRRGSRPRNRLSATDMFGSRLTS